MKNVIFSFDKEDANLLKGVAIIAMFFHHFFGFSHWRLPECQFIQTYIGSMFVEQDIALFCKICVGVFVFISGYSLYLNWETYNKVSNITKRVIRLLCNYWSIFLIFLLFGLIFKEPLPTIERLVRQLFGVTTATSFNGDYFGTIHPVFGWYVSFYILFLYLSPLLVKLCRFGFWISLLLVSVVLYGGEYLLSMSGIYGQGGTMDALLNSFATWGHIGMIGYLFAKHEIFRVVHVWLTRYLNAYVIALFACFSVVLMIYRWNNASIYIVYKVSVLSIYTPVFIYSIIYIIKFLNCKIINKILLALSKESMNMWFLHGLFFTPLKTIQWIAYFPRWPLLILVWTLFLVYIVSRLVTKLQNTVGFGLCRK